MEGVKDSKHALPFESISELKDAHAQLLDALDRDLGADATPQAEAESVVRHEAEAREFIERSAATGVYLENTSDRTAATVLLEYWVSTLSRAGRPATSLRLARFDAAQLPSLEGPCPFRGLDAFRSEDQQFFFGRETDTKALLDQVTALPLVIVSGASGSGKSSLVMSGLLPALSALDTFVILPVIRPGNAVLNHLASVAQGQGETPEAGSLLREDPSRLSAWLGDNQTRPAVVTIDQFEEVFTLASEQDRNALASSLAHLLGDGKGHRVVLTVRQEFQSRIVELTPLLPYRDKASFSMRAMNYDELRAAIDGPARIAKLQFQPGIADDLAKKVLGQAAALPLLQFTLRALWKEKDHNRITHEVYARVGDPLSALKRSADQFYDTLVPQTREEIKRVLVELVRVDDFLETYRQPVPLAHLLKAGKANTRDVLDLLREHDFISLSSSEGEDVLVEVKHESLVRNWPQYVNWIAEKRLSRRRRLTLTEAADRWATNERNPELLLTGWQLDEATGYADLSEKETAFVRASRDAADRDEREEKDRIRREGRARVEAWSTAFVVAVILVAVLSWLLQRSQVAGDRAALLAELAGARFLAESDTTAGVAAIGTALERHKSSMHDEGVMSVALRSIFSLPDWPLTQTKILHDKVVAGIILNGLAGIVTQDQANLKFWSFDGKPAGAFPSDGSTTSTRGDIRLLAHDVSGQGVIAVWADGSARQFDARGNIAKVWSSAAVAVSAAAFSARAERLFEAGDGFIRVLDSNGKEIRRVEIGPGLIDRIAASADGSRVISLRSGTLLLWDVASGRSRPFPAGNLPPSPQRGAQTSRVSYLSPISIQTASIDDAGHAILALDTGGIVRLWNPDSSGVSVVQLPGSGVSLAAFSPDGTVLTLSNDSAQLWTTEGTKEAEWSMPRADSITFSAHGDMAITTSPDDGTVSVWDLADLPAERVAVLRGHAAVVSSAVRDFSDQFVLTASADGTARLWNLRARLGANLDGLPVGFSSDSKRLITLDDRTVRIWDATFSLEKELIGHDDDIADAQLSPDGQSVATASLDTTARVWTIADGSFRELRGHTNWVSGASFSPDGRRILTFSPDRTARVWNLQGKQELSLSTSASSGFARALFSRDGKFIVTTDGEKAHVWDAVSGSSVLAVDDPMSRASLASDGQHLVTSDPVRVWDLKGNVVNIPSAETVTAIFTADGRNVFTATPAGVMSIWDLNGRSVKTFNAGTHVSAQLSQDAQLIVTSLGDGRLRLWNWLGQLLATIRGDNVLMSPDGRFMASTRGWDTEPRVWPISIEGYLSRFETLRIPCLTVAQLREGLQLDEAEAIRQVARCEATAQQRSTR